MATINISPSAVVVNSQATLYNGKSYQKVTFTDGSQLMLPGPRAFTTGTTADSINNLITTNAYFAQNTIQVTPTGSALSAADQKLADQYAAQTATPVAPAPVAPTPAQPTVRQSGYAVINGVGGQQVTFSDGSERFYANQPNYMFHAGETLDQLPTTSQILISAEQYQQKQADALAAQQAEAKQQADAIAARQAAVTYVDPNTIVDISKFDPRVLQQYGLDPAKQYQTGNYQADNYIPAGIFDSAAKINDQYQAIATAQAAFQLPDLNTIQAVQGQPTTVTSPDGTRYVGIAADPVTGTPAQWYKSNADQTYTAVGQNLQSATQANGPVAPIDQTALNSQQMNVYNDAQQYAQNQYLASIPYTSSTYYQKFGDGTYHQYTTQYQTQDPNVQGYIRPDDLAYTQQRDAASKAEYTQAVKSFDPGDVKSLSLKDNTAYLDYLRANGWLDDASSKPVTGPDGSTYYPTANGYKQSSNPNASGYVDPATLQSANAAYTTKAQQLPTVLSNYHNSSSIINGSGNQVNVSDLKSAPDRSSRATIDDATGLIYYPTSSGWQQDSDPSAINYKPANEINMYMPDVPSYKKGVNPNDQRVVGPGGTVYFPAYENKALGQTSGWIQGSNKDLPGYTTDYNKFVEQEVAAVTNPFNIRYDKLLGKNVQLTNPWEADYVTQDQYLKNQATYAQQQLDAQRAKQDSGNWFDDLISGIGDLFSGIDDTVRDVIPGGWLTVAAVAAAIVSGGTSLAALGEEAAVAEGAAEGAALTTSEASMIAADASSLAAQGLTQEQIAATLSQTYGVDAATAATAADAATTTVAAGGATTETLASAGIDQTSIDALSTANETGIGNVAPGAAPVTPETITVAPGETIISPETVTSGSTLTPEAVAPEVTAAADTSQMIPTVDAAGNPGFYDPATGNVYDSAGQIVSETAPVAPGPGTQVAEATQTAGETGVTSDVPYRVEVTGGAGMAEAPGYVTGQIPEGTQLATQAEIDAGTASYDAATNAWTVPVTTMPEVVVTAPAIPGGVTAGEVAAGLGGAAVLGGAGGGAVATPVAATPITTTTPTGGTVTTYPDGSTLTKDASGGIINATEATGGGTGAAGVPVETVTPTPVQPAPVTPPPTVEPQYPTTAPTEPVNPANPNAPDNIDVGGGFNPAEVPVTDATPVPAQGGGLPGSVPSGGLSATDLALLYGGTKLAEKLLTPPAIPTFSYGPIGDINWGKFGQPVNPGLNPGYLTGPNTIKPQYSGTPTQANYYWGQRPLIQDQSQLNTWNTAVPAQQPWGAAYAQGVGPNKLDVNQFIKQYITPEQYYATQGTSPQYAGPIAPATSYVGSPVKS